MSVYSIGGIHNLGDEARCDPRDSRIHCSCLFYVSRNVEDVLVQPEPELCPFIKIAGSRMTVQTLCREAWPVC